MFTVRMTAAGANLDDSGILLAPLHELLIRQSRILIHIHVLEDLVHALG